MAHSYYIYYRIDPAQTAAAIQRVRQLLDAVERATGIAGRLLRKRGEPNLWMEVYEKITDAAQFEWELAEAAGKLKATEFLHADSGRHTECFSDE